MRIIGGKDYYDGALAYGRDEDVVFVRGKHSTADVVDQDSVALRGVPTRFTLAEANGAGWASPIYSHRHGDRDYLFEGTCVWFAGKRYPGMVVNERGSWTLSGVPETTRVIWNLNEAVEFLNSIGLRLPKKVSQWGDSLADFFETSATEQETSWLIEKGIAVAIWHADRYGSGKGWKLNTDGLKDVFFARVVDPYTAFQELSMFVGGVMARPGNSMVRITDDEVLAGKHGFDKWSFRKMPGM